MMQMMPMALRLLLLAWLLVPATGFSGRARVFVRGRAPFQARPQAAWMGQAAVPSSQAEETKIVAAPFRPMAALRRTLAVGLAATMMFTAVGGGLPSARAEDFSDAVYTAGSSLPS